MKQRYEILYKNNEFLQEYIGRELWLDQVKEKNQINGKILNHSKTYTDIMHRILREHWKNCDVPVSPHKILIWSTDKNCKITSLSASHMIYDRKKKITFSDLINFNMGQSMALSYFGKNDGAIHSMSTTSTDGTARALNCVSPGAVCMFSTSIGMQWQVGIGQRGGNLRSVNQIQTACVSAPENTPVASSGSGAFSLTSGLLTNGISYASGGIESLTEVGTYCGFNDQLAGQRSYMMAYDLISFPTIVAQVVNISSSIQL